MHVRNSLTQYETGKYARSVCMSTEQYIWYRINRLIQFLRSGSEEVQSRLWAALFIIQCHFMAIEVNPIAHLFLSFFCFRFSFNVLPFFCSSRLPLSLFPLSPIFLSFLFEILYLNLPDQSQEVCVRQSLNHYLTARIPFSSASTATVAIPELISDMA